MYTMKSFRLELTEQEAEQLTELARQHGNKLKPFAEYLLRLQLGTVPHPTVQPVQIPLKDEPAKEQVQEAQTKVEPVQAQPVKAEPLEVQPTGGNRTKVQQAHKAARFKPLEEYKGYQILFNGACYQSRIKDVNRYAYTVEELREFIDSCT